MNPTLLANISRGVFLLLLQGLIFRRMSLGWGDFSFIQIIIYPLFILMLPIKLPKALTILIAFVYGFLVDVFYHSPGVHASATLMLALLRPLILNYLEPRGGYKIAAKPTRRDMGSNWFYQLLAIGLLIHLLWYFSMQVFILADILHILLRVLLCFIPSLLLMMVYSLIFDSKE
ncbi:MAG: hypothetical protein KTR24_15805 [Saprospiraceae bacterium]|nr:hypothetical protein [Saprospiraceae bacterium]